MIGKRPLRALSLSPGATLICGPCAAQSQNLEIKTIGDISYVSGEVGTSEQEALQQVKPNYNLRLLFAVTGSGAFLVEVPVTIADSTEQILVEAGANGPYFCARIPAGTYQVSAEHAGQVRSQTLEVAATGAVAGDFRRPSE